MAVTSGSPGSGLLFLLDPAEKEAFHENKKMANCHALALHPDGKHFVVTSTNRLCQSLNAEYIGWRQFVEGQGFQSNSARCVTSVTKRRSGAPEVGSILIDFNFPRSDDR